MILEGRVHRFGDDIDTDVIVPGRYLTLTDPAEIARHLFRGIDPEFVERLESGDILVAGRNFGCGSSREHAPLGLKAAGIACVVAESFARIFYRNAINVGLPIVICPPAARAARDGDRLRIDTDRGRITLGQRTWEVAPFPREVQELLQAGGLVPWVRAQLGRDAADGIRPRERG